MEFKMDFDVEKKINFKKIIEISLTLSRQSNKF